MPMGLLFKPSEKLAQEMNSMLRKVGIANAVWIILISTIVTKAVLQIPHAGNPLGIQE